MLNPILINKMACRNEFSDSSDDENEAISVELSRYQYQPENMDHYHWQCKRTKAQIVSMKMKMKIRGTLNVRGDSIVTGAVFFDPSKSRLISR